ncbi:SipW-cognate class signal peptide [Natronincola peptidivorans]|uniref:SipW-cognate class signal peptide n=1 Tax=Natronincola peptidivorans TaxID=426128 RepID=A0A1H9ZZ32_9FIRM|nr:SipW-dependent-type signal peptide-containing protein [Natronincola peptidivorans]SES87073.1 SipW-cognate class signal peptide [Natronincola peptidivorans]
MKKSRFLALILVVAVMMMGAGYAYWTQDLTIENTITTGRLEVEFEGPELVLPNNTYMHESSDFDIDDDADIPALKLDLVDAYPGAQADISFKLVNKGTLAAIVKGFDFSEVVGEGTNEGLVLCKKLSVDGNEKVFSEKTTLKDALLNELNIRLEPDNDHVEVKMTLQIDPDAKNNDLKQGQEGAIEFTINMKAYQYNDDTI